jgi:hypothetical protein
MKLSPTANYPERMNVFLTTEHFTLQSARNIINAEIISRVTIYFATLSSVLIASAFFAQIPQLAELFGVFIWIAFPVLIVLGLFTLARLIVLGKMDSVYIRAINRIRQFYVRAAPEVQNFLLFPPYDDDQSIYIYGGYSANFRGNLLSASHAVVVTNSIVATVLVSALISVSLGMTTLSFLPYGIGIFILMLILHSVLAYRLARMDFRPEYRQVRFPAATSDSPRDQSGE